VDEVILVDTGGIDNDGGMDIVTVSSWDVAPVQLWRNLLK